MLYVKKKGSIYTYVSVFISNYFDHNLIFVIVRHIDQEKSLHQLKGGSLLCDSYFYSEVKVILNP